VAEKKTGLAKRGQLYEVVFGYGLEVSARLAPGRQAADDDERVESFFPQQMRHPGAGRFARSSAVEIKFLIFRQVLDFLFQIVGLNADRADDAFGPGVVVAVAANVDDLDVDGVR